MVKLYRLFIVNKSGGLIYYRSLDDAVKLSTNTTMILGSTWHSLFTIAEQLSPVPNSGGIKTLIADNFVLACFAAPTGLKIFLVAGHGELGMVYEEVNLDLALKNVYRIYADYALKDPFYTLDQAIRSSLFDQKIDELVEHNR
eukprot:g4164.t1